MLKVKAFRGFRFDPKKTRWSKTLCPPYDVIGPEQARDLRADPSNAVHVELPAGSETTRYRNARKAVRRWNSRKLWIREERPAFYLCEQAYRLGGRTMKRTGVLVALGVRKPGSSEILAHERTYPGPKKDRMKLIRAVRLNTSPIFATFDDPANTIQKRFSKWKRAKPVAAGKGRDGIGYRFWVIDDPAETVALERVFTKRKLLVADGHHRFSVAYTYHQARPKGVPGSWGLLAYLVGERDPGLAVLPTHRFVKDAARVRERLEKHAEVSSFRSLGALQKSLDGSSDPRAFGLVDAKGREFFKVIPRSGKPGPRGRKLALDWVADNLLFDFEKKDLGFTPDAKILRSWVRRNGGLGIVIPDFTVGSVRRAVVDGGLLPQKSTYFAPKVPTGLVFRSLLGG